MPSGYDSDALAGLDTWLGEIAKGLKPGARKRMAMKLGRLLRRANLARIRKNVEPDGGAMEKRKSRLDRRGRLRDRPGGKMFRKLRQARRWRIAARPDSVELSPRGRSAIPAEHHFGKRSLIGRSPDGKKVFAKMPERRRLGFGDGDEDLALDVIAELIDP